jgi:hypothetical protein
MLESRGMGDQAAQASAQLPDQVDHEEHGGLLQQFGINPQELMGQGGGFGQGPGQQGGGFGQDLGQQGGGFGQDPGADQY